MQRLMLWQVLQRRDIHVGMLTAKSIYKDSKLSININSRVGPAVSSQLASSRAALSSPRCLGCLLMASIDT